MKTLGPISGPVRMILMIQHATPGKKPLTILNPMEYIIGYDRL